MLHQTMFEVVKAFTIVYQRLLANVSRPTVIMKETYIATPFWGNIVRSPYTMYKGSEAKLYFDNAIMHTKTP